jgi:uncharacterized protein involved in exopolysaccharide biosynthesis
MDSQAKSKQPASGKRAVDDEIRLLDYLRVVWRYRWMLLALCIIAMSVTVVKSLRTPRVYQSTVTIVPPLDILQRESSGALGSLNNSVVRQMMNTGVGSVAKMYVEILDSREVADAIIDRFRLMDKYEGIPYRSIARGQLKANTAVKITDGGAVKVTVSDRDPNQAAAIASAYVEELDKRNKKLSAGQATSKRIFLENRLKDVEARLSKIDNILSREAKTQETLYQLLVEQYEMAKMEEARSMPTIQVLDAAAVPDLPAGRGTVRKGLMAGVGMFGLGVFLSLGRDYLIQARRRKDEEVPGREQGSQAPVVVRRS